MGRGSERLAPARLGFWGMDPRVKPEDDSARGASWGRLSGEPPRASVTGSEIGAEKARCLASAR